MVDLREYLASRGANVEGWTLINCYGMSADGNAIVGEGEFNGAPRGYVVTGLALPRCEFVQQPTSVSVPAQADALFTAIFAIDGQTYQWSRNGVALTESARIQGTQTPTLTIQGVLPVDQGSYQCVVTGPCGTVTSMTAELSCRPVLVAEPPEFVYLRPGTTLSVTPGVPGATTYRWRQNGQNLFNIPGLFSGVTTSTLTLLADDPSLVGQYDCVVTNSCGNTTSRISNVAFCFPDVNCDGNLDQDDIDCLAQAVAGNQSCLCFDPDFNADGNVDQDDVAALAQVVAGGECP